MATTSPPTLPLTAAPITCTQPGGGFCLALELAWGRLRRGYLRRCWPGYVRRMAGLRQGECRGCPHDVIDSRDLKFYRNVCSYYFRPEDDAFAWRGRLGFARAGLAELLCFSALLALLSGLFLVLGLLHPLWLLPLIAVLPGWVFVVSFFRDPERRIPADADALLSPADGVVTHLGEVAEADFPGGRAFRVSIFLSVFNVHVNRNCRSGRVVQVRYFPGEYLDARNNECSVRNEQFWIDQIDASTGVLLRTKQIAGAIARRIVCWLRPDEEIRAGERFGMIKFGSRTEVYLPMDAVREVLVQVGDPVRGGTTMLLRMRS
jgi:phosphatidylserine decarboxylase